MQRITARSAKLGRELFVAWARIEAQYRADVTELMPEFDAVSNMIYDKVLEFASAVEPPTPPPKPVKWERLGEDTIPDPEPPI